MRLSHRGDRLELRQIGRPPFQPQQTDARTDRAAADEHDPPPVLAHRVNLLGELFDPPVVERPVALRKARVPTFTTTRLAAAAICWRSDSADGGTEVTLE